MEAQIPAIKMVKTGYLSTEFLIAFGIQIIGGLVLLGVFDQESGKIVQDSMTGIVEVGGEIVVKAGALVAQVMSLYKYITKRTGLKEKALTVAEGKAPTVVNVVEAK